MGLFPKGVGRALVSGVRWAESDCMCLEELKLVVINLLLTLRLKKRTKPLHSVTSRGNYRYATHPSYFSCLPYLPGGEKQHLHQVQHLAAQLLSSC